MGKAAERLNTGQPAISRSITELERELGVRLLDRHPHGIEPTEYGRALLECGATVFDDLRQGVKSIEFLADPTTGEVRIGCPPFLAASFVATVIDRLSARYPNVGCHLVVAQTDSLTRELSQRNVDLLVAARFGHLADQRLGFESLFDDSHVVVAGAQNPWVRRRRFKLSDLMNEPWILPPPDSVFGSIAMQAFRSSGLDYPRRTVCTAPADVRINLLATGRFLTIFAASVLKFTNTRPDLKVLPVELPLAPIPTGVVTLATRSLSPVAQLFIAGARAVAQSGGRTKL
jgi:DNA-binding transcriptional LysR family regulator